MEPIWGPPQFQCKPGCAHSAILDGSGAALCQWARGRPLITTMPWRQAHSARVGERGWQTAAET